VRNLLVMSGDYPVTGFRGRPAPVFDLDPVHILELIAEMNLGLTYPGPKGTIRHQPSGFFAGAAVSPFKATEAEQMVQYYKVKKKIAAGAGFVVTQLGYDARKFHETLQFLRRNGINVPLVGNVYVLTFGIAKLMNQNRFPGCVVTDKLLLQIEREKGDADKGVKAKLLRAARMYAILKGMGYSGVHIGGYNLRYGEVEEIVSQGESLLPGWQELIPHVDDPQPGGFYLYERDPRTGLNRETETKRRGRPLDAPVSFSYRCSRRFHKLCFEPRRNFFGLMQAICRRVERGRLEKPFHWLEHCAKVLLFDCRDCGDCALTDAAYSCPMSRCPKHMRNGACGGSFNGWCEVHPGKRYCIYVLAYARLKTYGEENRLDGKSIPPCNWDFYQSSSWINFYLGRDHTAKSLGIPEWQRKGENIC
jgi:methylenetetrahydrofolate reductase (NADPH)